MAEIGGLTASGGSQWSFPYTEIGFMPTAKSDRFCSPKAVRFPICAEKFLVVKDRAQDRDRKVGEVRSAFVELQPAHHAMLCQILRYTCFRNSQVLCKPRLDGIRTSPAAPSR